jgi:hypothetical protein
MRKREGEGERGAGRRWLTPVILTNQEAEIRRISVGSQPGQIVCETLSQTNKQKSQKRAGGVAQCIRPEFKPLYQERKRERERRK